MKSEGSSPTQEDPLMDPIFTSHQSSPPKGKGYAIPVQAPEGSRSLRLPDFKTIGT